jgi:hypothetical protein
MRREAGMSAITLPRRPPGRPSTATSARYEADLEAFCATIEELRSTVGFAVSSRGWCYILEKHGLGKGDFDAAQSLINDCRKAGRLPLDICADDEARSFDGLEWVDDPDPEIAASRIVENIQDEHLFYRPFSFWRDQGVYLQMMVEKIDLKSLFAPICRRFHVPIANCRGWSDINSRADMMGRFAEQEHAGKQCVLLYCGDHDPVGLIISDTLRSNMADLAPAVGWSPERLIIDRFGLNADFIAAQGLTWIDGLERFGARKVEANALVVRPQAARELCRQTILRYLPEEAAEEYEAALREPREQLRQAIIKALQQEAAP